jgi:hypothetical protein
MSPVGDGAHVVIRGARSCLRVDGVDEFEGVLLVRGGDGVERDRDARFGVAVGVAHDGAEVLEEGLEGVHDVAVGGGVGGGLVVGGVAAFGGRDGVTLDLATAGGRVDSIAGGFWTVSWVS